MASSEARVWRMATATMVEPTVTAGRIRKRRFPRRVLGERHETRGGQPAQGDGEQQHQQGRQVEVWDGEQQHRDAGDGRVRPAAGPDGGQDPRRDPDDGRQQQRRDTELDGDRQAVGDRRADRLAGQPRLAQVAADEAGDPVHVLLPQRLVQAEIAAQRGPLGLRRLGPEDRGARVTRQQAQQDEQGERDHEQDRDQVQAAAYDIGQHGATASGAPLATVGLSAAAGQPRRAAGARS
ncbi:hypothetical protein GCM10020358_12840 [Amorphoplanes nipponensis]